MQRPELGPKRSWKLEDAKARFSEVVRRARIEGPQRVTVYGRDAAVVLSAEDYARLIPVVERPSLYRLLAHSPLTDLTFDRDSVRTDVRDVEL